MPSYAAVPLVTAIAPVAAVALGHEHDASEVFSVLVSQLHRRVDTRGRAPRGVQVASVLRVDDERLRVKRARDVPAFVIVVVERLEIDVVRARLDAGELRDFGQPNACP